MHDSREILLFTPCQLICINAKSGLGCWHRHVPARREAQNQLEVFVHQAQGKLGTVVVAFDARQLPYVSRDTTAVLDKTSSNSLRSRPARSPRITASAIGLHADSEERVDNQLHSCACPGRPEMEVLSRDSIEYGLRSGKQFRIAAGQQRQSSLLCRGSATRNSDIQHIDTKPPSLFVQFPRGFGRDRAHFQHHGSRTRPREGPLRTRINALHGFVIGKTGNNHICAAGQFDDIVHGHSTIWYQSFSPSRILIEYDELVSMGKQTLGDPASHVAQPNKSEFYVSCTKILHIISFSSTLKTDLHVANY